MLVSDGADVYTAGSVRTDNILDGATRARCRGRLAAVLPTTVPLAYALHLEVCAVAESRGSHSQYMSIMDRVLFNLDNNGEFIVQQYPASKVCALSHRMLRFGTASAQRDAEVDRQLAELNRRLAAETERASTLAASVHAEDAARCPKCGNQNNITRAMAQMNSGDEGMKTRYLCPCGFRWKQA